MSKRFIVVLAVVGSMILLFLLVDYFYDINFVTILCFDETGISSGSKDRINRIKRVGWKQDILVMENETGKDLGRIKTGFRIQSAKLSKDQQKLLIWTDNYSPNNNSINSVYLYTISEHRFEKLLDNPEYCDMMHESIPYTLIGQRRRKTSKWVGYDSLYNKIVCLDKQDFRIVYTIEGLFTNNKFSSDNDKISYLEMLPDEYGDKAWYVLKVINVKNKEIRKIASNRRYIQCKWVSDNLLAYILSDRYEHLAIHLYDFSNGKDTTLINDINAPAIALLRYDESTSALYYKMLFQYEKDMPAEYAHGKTWFVSPDKRPQLEVITQKPDIRLPNPNLLPGQMLPQTVGGAK